jgi:hypothetical protein
LPFGQVIHGADPGEDPIRQAEPGRSGRHPAADLGHQLQQARLPEIAALAARIGSGQYQQVRSLLLTCSQGDGVGGEARVHEELLHYWVPPGFDRELASSHDFGTAVPLGGGHFR